MSVYDDIFKAARDGTVEDVKYFIEEKGVNVNTRRNDNPNFSGETALHIAAYYGKVEIVKYLISKGADVNAKNDERRTPLHNAAFDTGHAEHDDGKLEVAKILISEGADVNADFDGITPLSLAKAGRIRTEMVEYIESVGGVCKSSGGGGGCYVATCIYGSYNCPEVWTLRRFRDGKLSASWFGRRFIRTYYAVCPKIIKLFGNKKWFNSFWKPILNKFVRKLQNSGIDSSPYSDV